MSLYEWEEAQHKYFCNECGLVWFSSSYFEDLCDNTNCESEHIYSIEITKEDWVIINNKVKELKSLKSKIQYLETELKNLSWIQGDSADKKRTDKTIMSRQSTRDITRIAAIERIRKVIAYIKEKEYNLLYVDSSESEHDIQKFIDEEVYPDITHIEKWSNKMIEKVIDQSFYRFSMFENYIVID